MKTVKGNLIDMAFNGDFDVIVHGCNCQCRMRNGIANEIARRCPEAEEADTATERGCKDKLGTYSSALCNEVEDGWSSFDSTDFIVVNGYTQVYWGTNSRKVDYDAVRSVFKRLAKEIREATGEWMRIGYPKIGCGLAGGDWSIISKIIDEELEGLDHTYVEFEG